MHPSPPTNEPVMNDKYRIPLLSCKAPSPPYRANQAAELQEALTHTNLPTETSLPLRNLYSTFTVFTPLPPSTTTNPSLRPNYTPRSPHPRRLPALILPLQSQFLLLSLSSFPLCTLSL